MTETFIRDTQADLLSALKLAKDSLLRCPWEGKKTTCGCQRCVAERAIAQAEAANKPDAMKPRIEWCGALRPIGDPDPYTRLLGDIEIGGASFHVEAWQVTENEEGEQECADMNAADWYDYITGNMTEGAGQTVSINGRDYFIVVTPFQD